MDLGFHSMVSRALLMHVTADQGRCRAVLHNADNLSHIVQSMDSPADKQKFLAQHHGAFMIPKRLEFQGQLGDDTVEPELQKALHSEMEARLQHLGQRVSNLRTESEEIWKTLETAEINLLEILNTKVSFEFWMMINDKSTVVSLLHSRNVCRTYTHNEWFDWVND